MPEDLISLPYAKKHLRITGSEEDEDLRTKLAQAQAIVLDYIARPDEDWEDEIEAWTQTTVPMNVQAAILYQFGELYRFRGDDAESEQPKRPDGRLSPYVEALLKRYRDPVVS